MWEHTKKPPINEFVNLMFQIPFSHLGEVKRAITFFGGKKVYVSAKTSKTSIVKENQWLRFKQFMESQSPESRSHLSKKPFFEGQIKDWVDKLRKALAEVIAPCELSTNELENVVKQIAFLCGTTSAKESVPWEEVYPNFDASVALRGARKREGLTQEQLAKAIGISQTHISEMEHGKRPIGKEMAKRFSKALNVDYRVFL